MAWRAFAADTVESASGDKNLPLRRTANLLNRGGFGNVYFALRQIHA